MAIATMTPDNAPRDVQGLQDKGRFQRRELSKKLGATTEEQKAAFLQLTDDEQCKQLADILKAYDKQGGGGTASEPAAPAPATNGGLKRTPRNTDPDSPKAATATPGDNGAILLHLEKLSKEVQALNAAEKSLEAKVDTISTCLGTSLALCLLLAEQSLGARDEVLGAAIEDAKAVLDAVGKANKKK